ncbi:hypothetical protein D0T85_14540 [Bacteroides sp. 519]|nr:hypothetical protein [Bacteroides sp. 519]
MLYVGELNKNREAQKHGAFPCAEHGGPRSGYLFIAPCGSAGTPKANMASAPSGCYVIFHIAPRWGARKGATTKTPCFHTGL